MVKLFCVLIIAGLMLIGSSAWGQQFTPGLEYNNQPGLAAIKVYSGSTSNPSAYDSGYTGNGVKIGIVDSGINPSHVEFTNAIIAGMGWKRTSDKLDTSDNWASVTGTSNFSSFLKDMEADGTTVNGHGSFVASIASGRMDGVARTGNIMGSAYKSQLVLGTILFDQCETYDANNKCTKTKAYGLNDAQTSQVINYVSNQGVKVINNSWGAKDGGADPVKEHADYKAENPSTVTALKMALDKGAVIVFANGNDREKAGKGANPGAPAAMPTYDTAIAAYGAWITVAATNNAGTAIASYSNYCGVAKNYCIAAPGGLGNDATGMTGADAKQNDGYVYGAGTSYAAPLVSGAVALVAEKFPWMTNRNLATTILTTGSTASAPTTEMGRGLLDVGKAINGPGIFEEDFEANVTSGLASTFSNIISGTYGIKKLGAGTLTLSGANTFTGNTYLNGGVLIASAQNNLGNTSNALQFDGGTLKFGADFALSRNLTIGAGGGTLDINGYTKTQNYAISGDGQFGVTGGGTFTLDRTNSQKGGLSISGSAQARTQVSVQRDSYIAAAGSKITLNNGQLNLLDNFIPAEAGKFNRPLAIGLDGGTINTGNNELAYTGGSIESAASGNRAGDLLFTGKPFTMGANLKLNVFWNGNLTVPAGMTLSGKGGVANGSLTVKGVYAPGNSPGTAESEGSIVFTPGSELDIEIDGTGTGDGAGNYDRIVFREKEDTFTAGGALYPTLRNISPPANNNYTPPLGQGFQIVDAPGGVLGSFERLEQPDEGLRPGTRFDLVYGAGTLTLYVTPSSYSNIGAAGAADNGNRQRVGAVLEGVRPEAGVRESNPDTKLLFDNLAPQTAVSLPVAMDQLGGVGYAQLLGMNFEHSRFLVDQTMASVAAQHRGEGNHLLARAGAKPGDPDPEIWGTAIGRISTWQGDDTGYTVKDTLGGIMGGVQKRPHSRSLAGVAVAYGGSSPSMEQNMGGGQMNNLEVMGYGAYSFTSGFYLQGSAGGGVGAINAGRNVAMLNTSYNTTVMTANLAASVMTGWRNMVGDRVRYEAGVGVDYLGMHTFDFNDSGSLPAYAIKGNATDNQSFIASASASTSTAFQAFSIAWRASAAVTVGYECASNNVSLNVGLLNNTIEIQSGKIGRTRVNVGTGLSGYVAERTKMTVALYNQSADNWNATSLTASISREF
jgi:autotransporter-associated beta strand protein